MFVKIALKLTLVTTGTAKLQAFEYRTCKNGILKRNREPGADICNEQEHTRNPHCEYPYFTKALDAKDRPRQTTPAATIASMNLRITFYYYIVSYFYKLANQRGQLY